MKLEDKIISKMMIKSYINQLDEESISIVSLRLAGYTQHEIAVLLHLSRSQVVRRIEAIKSDIKVFFEITGQ